MKEFAQKLPFANFVWKEIENIIANTLPEVIKPEAPSLFVVVLCFILFSFLILYFFFGEGGDMNEEEKYQSTLRFEKPM